MLAGEAPAARRMEDPGRLDDALDDCLARLCEDEEYWQSMCDRPRHRGMALGVLFCAAPRAWHGTRSTKVPGGVLKSA